MNAQVTPTRTSPHAPAVGMGWIASWIVAVENVNAALNLDWGIHLQQQDQGLVAISARKRLRVGEQPILQGGVTRLTARRNKNKACNAERETYWPSPRFARRGITVGIGGHPLPGQEEREPRHFLARFLTKFPVQSSAARRNGRGAGRRYLYKSSRRNHLSVMLSECTNQTTSICPIEIGSLICSHGGHVQSSYSFHIQ